MREPMGSSIIRAPSSWRLLLFCNSIQTWQSPRHQLCTHSYNQVISCLFPRDGGIMCAPWISRRVSMCGFDRSGMENTPKTSKQLDMSIFIYHHTTWRKNALIIKNVVLWYSSTKVVPPWTKMWFVVDLLLSPMDFHDSNHFRTNGIVDFQPSGSFILRKWTLQSLFYGE